MNNKLSKLGEYADDLRNEVLIVFDENTDHDRKELAWAFEKKLSGLSAEQCREIQEILDGNGN